MESSKFKRSISLSKREYEELLASMESATEGGQAEANRSSERLVYRVTDIPLCIEHPDGGQSCYYVYGGYISREGMSVLHGGYVHAGSGCRVVLGREESSPMVIDGKVHECRHLAGSCHELCIQFHEEIDIEAIMRSRHDVDNTQQDLTNEMSPISGCVLLCESYEPDRFLLELQLNQFQLDVISTTTTGETLDQIKTKPIDLLLYGLHETDEHALRMIRMIREYGWDRPMILLAANMEIPVLSQIRSMGNIEILSKPWHVNLLISHMLFHLTDFNAAPLMISTTVDPTGMAALTKNYIKALQHQADQIENDWLEQKLPNLLENCRQIITTGCNFGLHRLTATAIKFRNMLELKAPKTMCEEAKKSLVTTCRLLSSSRKNNPSTRLKNAG